MKFFLGNPVNTRFRVTNAFNSPRSYANGLHEGIDLRALEDGKAVDILAAQRGVVDHIRWNVNTGYGNYVRVRHEWDDDTVWVTWYAHMGELDPAISVGTRVRIGQRLGLAGGSGNATGVHLHLTLQHLGYGLSGYAIRDVVDPRPYFKTVRLPDYDEAAYVADITVPDGAVLRAGQPFNKTWQLRNTGTTTWGAGHVLAFSGEERLDGPDSVPLPELRPGEIGEVTVPLVAPQAPGRHRSTWQGRGPGGEPFRPELYVDFIVSPVARRNGAVYVDDVTIPDGSVIAPGQVFHKTWRVRNTGDAPWDAGYGLGFTGDHPLDAPGFVPVTTARPGATADVSVTLRAPDEPSTYRSTWRLRDAAGHSFGDFLFAEIVVERKAGLEAVGDAAVCLGETVTPLRRVSAGEQFIQTWTLCNTGRTQWDEGYTLAFAGDHRLGSSGAVLIAPTPPGENCIVSVRLTAPVLPGRYRSSWQPRNPAGKLFGPVMTADLEVVRLGTQDKADFLADVTIPDGTLVEPRQMLTKTWRVRNNGTSAWTPGYAFAFVADDQMDGPDSVPLPLALPGEEVEVTVTLVAPDEPGLHRSSWRARNSDGRLFGDILFAEIRVPSGEDELPRTDDARLDSHVTVPNGSQVTPGDRIHKVWAVRNTGTTTWEPGYTLAFVGGDPMDGPEAVPVPTAAPEQVVQIAVDLVAPTTPDKVIGRWRLRDPQGKHFGPTFFVSIIVTPDEDRVDLMDYLRGDGRLYEMKHIFQTAAGLQIGQQRIQTQTEGRRFYIVKNQEWEELWYDNDFIYRGTDTSPGNGNFYTLMEDNRYGSPWVPREMAPGHFFRRSPTVVSRRKGDCNVNFHLSGTHVTWIRLEKLHAQLRLPDPTGDETTGLLVRDVVELAAYSDEDGRPAAHPFERYYYARGLGMVMWAGIDVDHRGRSFLIELHAPGARPNNQRERIPCLEQLLRSPDP
jgi:hypothetical protein